MSGFCLKKKLFISSIYKLCCIVIVRWGSVITYVNVVARFNKTAKVEDTVGLILILHLIN
jgi:hypothetical protein